jgi:hypothetical protein
MRKLFIDFDRFRARLDRLEQAHDRAEGKQQVVMPEPVEEPDEPAERQIALVEEMLRERLWEEE